MPGMVFSAAPQLAQSLREGVAAAPFFFFFLVLVVIVLASLGSV